MSFQKFLSEPAQAPKQREPEKKSYQEYSESLWAPASGHEIEHNPPIAISSSQDFGLSADMNAAQRFIELSKMHRELSGQMRAAEAQHDPIDVMHDDGHRPGLKALVAAFSPKPPKVQAIKLPPELVQEHGGDVSKLTFGVRKLESEEVKVQLQRDVELAKKYFGDIKLHIVTDKNGVESGVVMGIDAQEFNAVIRAEREKERIEAAAMLASKEMHQDIKLPKPELVDMNNVSNLAANLPAAKHDPEQIKPADNGFAIVQSSDKGRAA